ncbi:MAG: Na/Pi cotransporter family protein [Phycisphaerae bacterium]|nr:Na/Pi cotransporter family protein [Phycisphaerae bacterium]
MQAGTAISVIGGLGLFLLGMGIMTEGLRALAGSSLRAVLARAAATPARGAVTGCVATLVVQSSSATTMTTIGLVSAGLLTFPQALGVVFGANLGTTGTGWLVALLGVKVSLAPAAMPLILAGAVARLLGRGRWASAGGAVAGYGLLLLGLTVLQQGMAGLAERVRPEDLPRVGAGLGGALGIAQLAGAGIVMTVLMQSSSAAIAVTLSALAAGAVGPEQAAALVIGQHVGSSISTAIAAIGSTTPAARTAAAHILFNVATGGTALVLLPAYVGVIAGLAERGDGPVVLAAFHSAYNLAGVVVMVPLAGRFARVVERLMPQRGAALERRLDRSVRSLPQVAVEAVRLTVAESLGEACRAVARGIERRGSALDGSVVGPARRALTAARVFASDLGAVESAAERHRLAHTLHALDHASRLAENWIEASEAGEAADGTGEAWAAALSRLDDARAAEAADLCARALRLAGDLCTRTTGEAGVPNGAGEDGAPRRGALETEVAGLADLERLSKALADLRRAHRPETLASVAGGAHSAAEAIALVEWVRRLDRLGYHAWRGAWHLARAEEGAEQV